MWDFIVKESHAVGIVGHFGGDKTIQLVADKFYWPHLRKDVSHVIQRYRTCQLSKGQRQNVGLYNIDFVLGLPLTVHGHDSIFVVVDRFFKMTYFLPYSCTYDVSRVATTFFSEVVCFGLPKTIMSDCDVKFYSYFWKTLWAKTKIQLNFSSSFHPQTDSQTETINRSLGNLLRCLVMDHHTAWDLLLTQVEFA